ncbi:MAG TPA: peptide-binding protein [Phycisphaeraceae bacterium]
MDNRFGFKDLVFTLLLAVFIISVWLAMKQMDRHGDVLRSIDQKLTDQTRDLARLRRLLDQGSLALNARHSSNPGPATQGSSDQGESPAQADPFARIRAVQQNPDYALGDFYVDVFAVVPDRLTPLVSSDVYASTVQSYVLESLAQRDPETLEWQPLIASDWTIEDNTGAWRAYMQRQGAEGAATAPTADDPERPIPLAITFRLRPGVVFSDGEPLTADDVVFTFDWIMNPEVEAPRERAYYEKIQRVEKVDELAVRFVFKEPYYQAFELAAVMPILPEHFYSRWTPQEFNQSTGLLMGSGPYRLEDPESWRPEPGKNIELVRNERYWGEPPAFDRLVWRIIENDAARLTTFRNGDIDEFPAQPEQYQMLLKDPDVQNRTQHFEFQSPTAGYLYIGWNQQRNGKPTIFADRRVRQALTMLIDRQRIVDEVMLGYAQVVSGPFNPLSPQSDPSVEPWPYDPTRAAALLKEVGFEDRNRDGVLELPDGRPLRFELNYPAGSEVFERIVLFIKDTLARGGVVMDPKPLEWSVLLQRVKDDRNYDAVSLGWSGTIESDPYQIFHSSQIPAPGDNSTSYANPRLDALIEQARMTVNEEERMPLWHQVHRILHEDQPYTFLFTRKTLVFFDGRIKNIQRTRLGLNPLQEWYVPQEQRKWSR